MRHTSFKTSTSMVVPLLFLLANIFQCSVGSVLRRSSKEPLNVQNAVDLDEMDVDIDSSTSSPSISSSTNMNMVGGAKSDGIAMAASASIQGDVTIMPLSNTPIDMSVIPEPVPKVDLVEPSSLPSYGGIGSLRIIGQHFGTEMDLDQVVSINGRACKETKWISVTELECIGPASFTVGTNALVQVSVARSTSDPEIDGVTLEYEPPIVSRIIPAVGPTHGHTLIRVLGRNLGDLHVAGAERPTVMIGTLPCAQVVLINSTEIHCVTGRLDGEPGNYIVSVSVDGVTSNTTAGPRVGNNEYTYELPTVQRIEPAVGPTFGVTRITLHGSGYGKSSDKKIRRSVIIGSKECKNIQVVSDVELSCELPPSQLGQATPDGVAVDLLIDSQKAINNPGHPTDPLLFHYVKMIIDTVGVEQVLDENDPVYESAIVMKEIVYNIIGDQLAPWNVRPENCDDKNDLEQCSTNCLLSEHLDSDSKLKCDKNDVNTVEHCNGGGRFTCLCQRKGHKNGRDTSEMVAVRPKCKVNAELVPAISFDDREDERAKYTCPRVEVVETNHLRCHLPKDNGLGGSMNVTVVRNQGLGKATISAQFLQRPVITGVKASEDFQSGPLTLVGYWLGNNKNNNLFTVMIGDKKCMNVQRKLLTEGNEHPEEGTLTCVLEKGSLSGPGGLDVRIYAKDISTADMNKGVNAELRINVEIPNPIILSVTPSVIGTYGRSTLTISGESVASMLFESTVAVGNKPCLNVVKVNPDTLTCTAPSGPSEDYFGPIPVTVNILTHNGTNNNVLKYGRSEITQIIPPRVESVGGQIVTVRGLLLGDDGKGPGFPQDPLLTLGGASCTKVKRSPKKKNEFTCLTGPSKPGFNLMASLSLDEHDPKIENPVVEIIPPQIVSLNPTEGPTYGENVIVITGTGFGKKENLVAAFVGDEPCIKTTLVSEKKVLCVAPKTTSEKVELVRVEVSSVPSIAWSSNSTDSIAYKYINYGLLRIDPSFGPAYGNTTFKLFGRFLGRLMMDKNGKKNEYFSLPDVSVGGVPCVSSTLIEEEGSGASSGHYVTCVTPPSVPGEKTIDITVNEVKSTENVIQYDYRVPEIKSISPNDGPTYGGVVVDILGEGLGTEYSQPLVKFGAGVVCENPKIIEPHTHLQCLLPSTVNPGATTVTVSVNGVVSKLPTKREDHPATFNYQPPIISSLTPDTGATYGDWLITITGEHFGRGGKTSEELSTTVSVGGTPCRDIKVFPDERKITCTTPNTVPGKTKVVVEVGGVPSEAAILHSKGPAVDLVSPSFGPSYGGNTLIVSGTHLADLNNPNVEVEVFIGDQACTDVVTKSETHVECSAPSAHNEKSLNKDLDVSVKILGVSTKVGVYQYQPPQVDNVLPRKGPVRGGTQLTIVGNHLAGRGEQFPPTVRLGKGESSTTCEVIASKEKSLHCITNDRIISGKVPVVVSVDGISSKKRPNTNASFTFVPPIVEDVTPNVIPTYGNTVIDVQGNYFGNDTNKLFVVVGGIPCTDLELIDDTHLRCIAPPNRAPTIANPDESHEVVVTYNKASSTKDGVNVTTSARRVRYKAPELRRVVPDHSYRDENRLITLEGRFLGKTDNVETSILLGNNEVCEKVRRITEHMVTCIVPPGFSGTYDVSVRVGEDTSTLVQAFRRNYGEIILDRLSSTYLPFWTDTKLSIVLHTYGLSSANNLKIKIGGADCTNIKSTVLSSEVLANHTLRQLECVLLANKQGPPGEVSLVVALRDGLGEDVEMNATTMTVGHPRFSIEPNVIPSYGRAVGTFKYQEMSDVVGEEQLITKHIGSITVGGLPCVGVKVDSATKTIQCSFPRGPAGDTVVKMELLWNGKKTLIGEIPITYAAPIVTQSIPSSGTTLGGDLLKLVGKYFGQDQDHVRVKIGGQTCNHIQRYNETLLHCVTGTHLSAEGNYPIEVTVTAADEVDSSKMTDNVVTSDTGAGATEFRYRGPTASGIQPPFGTPFGGDIINISGTGFGSASDNHDSILAFVGGKPCKLTTWLSESTVECVTPAGFGEMVDVTVSVAGKTFDVPDKFKYLKPRVISSIPNRGPAWRPTRITLRGPSVIPSDLEGESAKTLTVRIGPSQCTDVEIVRDYKDSSKNILKCTTTPVRVGSMTYPIIVSDGTKFSDPKGAANFTFEDPIITERPLQQPFYGEIEQAFFGRNFGNEFGLKPENFTILIGDNECPNIKWVSDNEIKCTPNENTGAAVPITVVVNDWDSEPTDLSTLAFNEPLIRFITPGGIPTYGTDKITITGANLGTPAMYKENRVVIDVDGQKCENLKLIASPRLTGSSIINMAVECDAPPAQGAVIPHFSAVSILIDDVHGNTNQHSLRYLSPVVHAIHPASVPATGYEDILIRGDHFGDGSQVLLASVNGTLCEETTWISESSIKCKVPPGHTEAKASIIVSVNGQTNPYNLYNQLLRYTGPKVLAVMPVKGPAYGGTRITLTGRGLASTTTPVVGVPFIKIANSSCVDVEVISDEKVTCTTTDSFDVGFQPIRLKLWTGTGYSSTDEEEAYDLTNDKNQSNTVRRFFYDGPVIRHISPSDGAAYGGDLLHLWGTNFGNGSIFTEVHVGKHGVCNNLTVLSDEHITCNTPAGATRNNPIALQVGLNVARQVKNFTFHYRLPYVQCVDPAFTTTGGGERITLLGRDFGTPELKPMAFINGTECTNLKYVSEHVLTCIAPPMKAGTGYDVIVTVLDGETGTYHEPHFIFSGIDNRLMSYNRPIVDGVGRNSVTSGPAYGHQEFEVLGEHVGHGWDLEPPTVYIGSMPCLETLILTNFSLLCMTPMYNNSVNGGFKELPVTVRLGPTDSITVPSLNYTFLRPIVTNVEGSSFGPEYGGTKLTLVGVGLGVPIVARPKIFVGNSPCEEVKVIDDTRVTCVTTEGAGSHLNVTLFNGMDAAVKTEFKFTYQQSVVTEITPTKVRWFGNEWIIVDGIHLGSMRYPPVVTIDGALCLKTRYMGGSLQCLAPPGSKSEAVVVVRVGNTTSRRNNNENMTDYVEFTPPVIRSITAGISIPNGKEGSNKTEGIAAVPQYGGGWVSIRGDNLAVTLEDCYDKAGCASLNTSIVIGTSVCNRSMIERDGITGQPTLLCQTTAKARAGNKAVKIIANGMESKSMNLLFSAPVVESVSPPEGAFNEKHRLTIRGNFFGDKSGNMSTEVTVGGQPCDHVVRRSPELLSCLSPIGVEFMTGNSNDTTLHDAPIRVSVDGISSTGRVVFTRTLKEDANKTNFEYLPPVISSLADEKKGPAFGYRNITLYGDNFGLVDSGNVVAMIHGHPCVSTQWVSKTKLTCVTPTLTMDDRIQHDIVQEEHSTEVPAAVAVVIDGVHNDDTVPTVYYNYLLPRIFKVSPSMGPAYGGTKITILGKRLGDQTLPGQVLTNVQLGPFMCENITVVDQFEVKCITAPGRNTFPVNLNVNGVPSIYNTSDDNDPNSTTTSFTYLPMEVHTLSRKEVPSYGGDRVVIQGKYLGDRADQHPIAFIGGRPCRETIWINPEKIVCITPHSPAGNHHVSVSIGATTSLITRDTPSIKVIDPTVRSIDVNKGGAAGGENITIQGEYFGSTGGANDIIALVGGVPCSRTYSLSERSVICTTPARFIGDSKALISVSVDGHMENSTKIGSKRLSRIVYNYRILRVTSIDIDSGPTEGGYEITIYGESFGKTSVAYIGERRCQKTIPNMDHHSLVCVVPEGVGAGHIVEVRVRKTISSLTASDEKVRFNYDLPTVTELKPARFDKHGGEIINITGSNFGPAEHPLIVHIGDMMALDVMHHSHTSFSCVTPPGKGQGKIIVTVANQTSASNDATISTGGNYLYIPAEITSFEPKFGPTSGGWLLTIYGRGFGPNAEELAAANKTAKKEMEEDLKIEDELDMDEIKKENNAISAANKTLTEEELEEEASKKAFLNAEKAMEKAELDGDKNATSNAAKEEQLEEADEERRMAEAKSLENAAVEERKKRAAKAEAIEKIALARSEARLDEEKKASEDAEKEEDEKESSLESKADAADGVETKESDETIKAAKIPTVGDHQSTEELDFAAANAAAAPTDESEMDKLDHLAEESAKRFRDTELNTNDQASPSMRFRQSSDGASNVVPSMMKALPTGYVSPQVVVSRNSDLSQFIFEDNLLEVDQKTNDEKRRLKRAQAAYRLSEWAQKSRNADPYEPFVAAPRFREERHTKTITGSKTFSRGVWINGVPCSNVTWVSDSKITCIVPEGVGGHLNVKLVTPMDGGVAAEILNNETTYLSYTPALVESVDIDIGYYGTIIVAKGSNFGNFSIPTAYIGNRPCTETTRLSYNTVRCVVPKGAGKDLPVTVAVGGQRGLIDGAATYSYPPPQVLRTFPDGGSGKGGNIVTIMGRNYGDAESLGNVTVGMIGERKCIKTTIVSDTLIECVAPSGVGRNLHISIWANGQESVTPVRYVHSNGTSMMKLVDTTTRNVTDVEGTKNSTTIVLVGGNNGTVAGNKSSNGTSARLTAAFMASGAEVSDEALYSYPTPEISLIVPDSVSGKGGDVIEIHGNSFGESGASIKVSIDKKPCVDIEIISSKLIKCKTPPGKGDAKPVIVITGGQPSKLYDWFEYDGPRIWFSSPNRVIKEQDEKTKITFTGVHLGLNEDDANVQALTVGGYPCSEPKRVSSKEWSCTIREMGRMGKNAPVQIHLPNRKRPSPPNVSVATFNFKAEPEVMINIPSFGSKDGGEEMSIEGIFGPSKPLSVNVQIGGESCDNSEWISPRQIKCLYVIPGKGHKTVSVQVNGAIALLSKKNTIKTEGSLTYDYDPPIVVSISPKRGPTAGGVPITIKGKFDGVASVTVRGAECPIKSFDATYITCTLPEGVGAQAPLRVVSLEGSQSPAIPFAYDGPVVVETGPKDLSPKVDDGRRLWVRVNNLGPQGKENEIAEHIAVVLEDSPLMEEKEKERKAVDSNNTNSTPNGSAPVIDAVTSDSASGGELCSDVRWGKEPNTITCVPSPGFGYRSLIVVVSGQKSPVSNMSYAPAVVAGIHPISEDPGKEIKMTIVGSRFTSAPIEVMSVYIGKQECRNLNIESDSQLTCNITVRPGGNKFVNVQIADLKSSKPGLTFTATPPTVDKVEPNSCKLSGGCLLKITGANYFMNIPTAVSLGKLACENVQVLSMNTITCVAPRGTSGSQMVVVDIGGARNDDEESIAAQKTSGLFSYPAATVNKVRPTHGAKTGGTTVIVEGAGFGETLPAKGALDVLIGGKPCTSTKWISDSKIECVTPPEPASIGDAFNCVSVQVSVKSEESKMITSARNSKFRYEHKGADSSVHSVQITPSNVDQIITGDRPALIKICMPGCEKCTAMKHAWNEMARLMRCKNVIIGTIRGDLYPQLMERYAVDEYPRLVWFSEGRTAPTKEYTGLFSAERIIGWIARQFGKANDMWSPLEDGDPGTDWKKGSGDNVSPLVMGQGLPLGSSSVCKAVALEKEEKPVEGKKKRFFFF